MPKRTDIHKILLIGSGPIVIGQACEFDYSGTQACRVLREEGYEVILANSNPATIMTDPDFADATYIEPLTVQVLKEIIVKERPDALLPTLGGQTALNLAMDLEREGILDEYNVELIGADAEAISTAEDGAKFKVGNKVKMTVKLLGDYSKVDQLKFVAQKIGETGTVVRTSKVRQNQSAYGYKWTAKAGNYTLKVAAFSKGVVVANVRANVTVENPPKLTFRFVKNGQSYKVGNKVKMHIRASGNMTEADQIKFVVQKDGGVNQVIRSYNVNPSKKAYNKTWVPKEAGNYKLKAEAYKNGVFVSITVVNIKVTKKRSFESRSHDSNEVQEEQSHQISTYPNPSLGMVNVDLGNLKNATIRVSNSSGQIVYEQIGLSGIHQFELNSKPGLYFIEITSESKKEVFKLIKK